MPAGIAFGVNDVAGFFNANSPVASRYNVYQLGPRHYGGNGLRAQAFTLVHEVAHQIFVPGFQSDFNKPKAEEFNNKAVDSNCRQMIEGLQ